jgi:gluconolactonase
MSARMFATGLGAPEGPISLPDGSMYVTEMSANTSCVTHLDPHGCRRVIRKTGGRPNGLALDGNGNIWIAEAILRAVICIDPEGHEIMRIDGDESDRFLFPNDLAFGPDGHLYMTDSGMVAGDFISGQNFVENFMDLPWDGRVYELNPTSGRIVRRIDSGIRFTNGIAFDGADHLYANASFTGEVYRYDVFGSSAPKRELFGNVLQPDDRPVFRGPDGMKFGADGRLYCTVYNQRNVTVLGPNGQVADRLMLDGDQPTNCAFSLDGTALLVTEVSKGQVEALPAPCPGLKLHAPKLAAR